MKMQAIFFEIKGFQARGFTENCKLQRMQKKYPRSLGSLRNTFGISSQHGKIKISKTPSAP